MARKLTLSVSQLNEYVRRVLQLDPMLHGISLKGEISNLKFHQTGTLFFTLKDEEAAISCVMYPQEVKTLSVQPFEGMRATVSGSVGLYARGGQYQFYVDSVEAQGVGVLYERLMALKTKLAGEGLFDRALKKPLPMLADTIGVVSSPTGAVIHDILNVSLRRDPQVRILLCPVRVQGMGAAQEVAQAIALLDRLPSVSVIIVARGGGSIEDLWTFNEEEVVRAVAACSKPVVSAVGHEPDVTLCDLAADLRAPTPSAAAECVVAQREALYGQIEAAREKLSGLIVQTIRKERAELDIRRARLAAAHPRRRLGDEAQRLLDARSRLSQAMQIRLKKEEERLSAAKRSLGLLSPYQVLSRGYAIVRRGESVVTQCSQVVSGDEVSIRLADGVLRAGILDE